MSSSESITDSFSHDEIIMCETCYKTPNEKFYSPYFDMHFCSANCKKAWVIKYDLGLPPSEWKIINETEADTKTDVEVSTDEKSVEDKLIDTDLAKIKNEIDAEIYMDDEYQDDEDHQYRCVNCGNLIDYDDPESDNTRAGDVCSQKCKWKIDYYIYRQGKRDDW